MGARSKARKRALDVLFESDQRGVDAMDLLDESMRRAGPPLPEYAADVVRGVVRHCAHIDELLSTYSQGWTLDRMPAVDRAVLRIGAWEVLYAADVPTAVAIDEAVSLARSLSTDQSPGFVNGLLARIASLGVPAQAAGRPPGGADVTVVGQPDPRHGSLPGAPAPESAASTGSDPRDGA